MPRAPESDFRRRMGDVAAEMFAEVGPGGFKMRDLAKRFGVSAMTPYRYFDGKDEILASVRAVGFSRLAERLRAVCMPEHTPEHPPKDMISALGRAYLAFAEEEQSCYRLMFDLSQPSSTAGAEVQTVLMECARILLKQGRHHGDSDRIGSALWSALHGVAALRLGGQIRQDVAEAIFAETARYLAAA